MIFGLELWTNYDSFYISIQHTSATLYHISMKNILNISNYKIKTAFQHCPGKVPFSGTVVIT